MDGGDGGNAEVGELVEGALAEFDQVLERVALGGGEHVEVRAGDEDRGLCRADEQAFDRAVLVDFTQFVAEFDEGGAVE